MAGKLWLTPPASAPAIHFTCLSLPFPLPSPLHHQTVEAKDAHIGELQERLRHVLDSGDVANADHEAQINKLVISMTQMKEAYSSQVGGRGGGKVWHVTCQQHHWDWGKQARITRKGMVV